MKVIGVDTTIYKLKGERIVTGTVTDALRGEVLEVEILEGESAEEIREWIEGLVEELGVEVMVSDDADFGELSRTDCYKEVADELALCNNNS